MAKILFHIRGSFRITRRNCKKENAKGLSNTADDILITNGVSEGLDMVISSIVEEGDEVLLPGPYYPPYASYVRLHGGVPVEFSVDLNNSTPDFDDIKSKITSKTVAICLISQIILLVLFLMKMHSKNLSILLMSIIYTLFVMKFMIK